MKQKTFYAVKHSNENIRAVSRSGGIFTAISDVVLKNGGAVYGCALNDNLLAEHRRATTKGERDTFRGSKYIQSEINDCYSLCANDLKAGLQALFAGTPCQIEALYNFLKIKNVSTENLVTIDILCHGVPSPMVWKDYINAKFGESKIETVDFRDKKNFGWRAHVETITVDGKEISSKDFPNLFLSHLIIRPSCFNCNYKNRNRISDITIGDYWKIEDNDQAFDDNKGVSLVKPNTKKGMDIFEQCKSVLIFKEFPIATSIQPVLVNNFSTPRDRNAFWNEYSHDNVLELIKKYTTPPKPTTKQKIKLFAYKVLKMLRIK